VGPKIGKKTKKLTVGQSITATKEKMEKSTTKPNTSKV
jgi:hypothetical protein